MIATRALPADTDLLALHRLAPERYPLLLESAAASASARWDMLLASTGAGLRLDADGVTRQFAHAGEVGDAVPGTFLDALDARWNAERRAPDATDVPFRGGWALFFAYELAAQIEPSLRLPAADGPLPVAMALRCPAAVVRDRSSGAVFALAEAGHDDWLQAIATHAYAAALQSPLPPWRAPGQIVEDPPLHFLDGVRRIHDYLLAGDVFQVNLSRAWRMQLASRPDDSGAAAAALYARLRQANPAPFAGLLAHAGWALASSSPERLVSVQGDRIQSRPIAGTRPRVAGDDDAARIRELAAHPKERAEHIMLIDLERNDLGRLCVPGSVEVDELMTIESYAHVHHIVSNVRGTLRTDVTPGAVIAAVFPGGTITGCPKVRCMQIIAELESEGRGPYTGALGYLNHDGDMDLNILIRSVWLSGDRLELRAGAGIVVDSQPERELAETRAKARGLLRALGVAA